MKRKSLEQKVRKKPGRLPAGGLLLLCLGGFVFGGSIYLGDYIKNLTYSMADQGLIGIQDAALPLVEPMVKQRGVSEVLSRVREMGVPAVEDMITQMGPAIALPLIRENALPIVHEIVNATFMAKIIDTFESTFSMDTSVGGYDVQIRTTPTFNLNSFFNDAGYNQWIRGRAYIAFLGIGLDWSNWFNVLQLKGISNQFSTSLGYSGTAQNLVMYGNNTGNPGSPGYIPGWLQDTSSGSGVMDFLEMFENAYLDPGLRPAMQTMYDCSWVQLDYLHQYLRNYVEGNRIKAVIDGVTVKVTYTIIWEITLQTTYVDLLGTLMPALAGFTSTAQIADTVFYDLWANGQALGDVLYPGGMDFGDFLDGVSEGATGFEACVPGTNTTGLTHAQSLLLWDDESSYALTNLDGIAVWYGAFEGSIDRSVLTTQFGITLLQTNMILDWLWGLWGTPSSGRFGYHLLPILLNTSLGFGVTIDVLAEQIIYEQWSNLTVLDMPLYPTGLDLNDIVDGAFGGPVYGLEAGLPASLGLTISQCYALWDESNSLSLLDMSNGIAVWHDAIDDAWARNELMAVFGLSGEQMDALLSWLWDEGRFSDYLVPLLIESPVGYNMPLSQFCMELLYSQWANGTILGAVLFPYPGFPLPLKGGIVYGFEVGVPTATNMTVESAYCLWDTSSEYSLVTPEGIAMWTKAVGGDTTVYSTLKAENHLTDHAMGLLLVWLPKFQHNVMPYLAQESMDLPADSVTLANDLLYGGMAIGAAIMLFGVLVIARRAKKRKAWRATGEIDMKRVAQDKRKALMKSSGNTSVPGASTPAANLPTAPTAPASVSSSRPVKPVLSSASPQPKAIPAVKSPPPAPTVKSLPPAPPTPPAPLTTPTPPSQLPSLPPVTPVQRPTLETHPLPPVSAVQKAVPEARQVTPVARPVFEQQQVIAVKKEAATASPLASYNQRPFDKPLPEISIPANKVEEPRPSTAATLTHVAARKGSNPVLGKIEAIGQDLGKFNSGAACADAIKAIRPSLEPMMNYSKIRNDMEIWVGQLGREPWDGTTQKMIQKRIKNWVEKLER